MMSYATPNMSVEDKIGRGTWVGESMTDAYLTASTNTLNDTQNRAVYSESPHEARRHVDSVVAQREREATPDGRAGIVEEVLSDVYKQVQLSMSMEEGDSRHEDEEGDESMQGDSHLEQRGNINLSNYMGNSFVGEVMADAYRKAYVESGEERVAAGSSHQSHHTYEDGGEGSGPSAHASVPASGGREGRMEALKAKLAEIRRHAEEEALIELTKQHGEAKSSAATATATGNLPSSSLHPNNNNNNNNNSSNNNKNDNNKKGKRAVIAWADSSVSRSSPPLFDHPPSSTPTTIKRSVSPKPTPASESNVKSGGISHRTIGNSNSNSNRQASPNKGVTFGVSGDDSQVRNNESTSVSSHGPVTPGRTRRGDTRVGASVLLRKDFSDDEDDEGEVAGREERTEGMGEDSHENHNSNRQGIGFYRSDSPHRHQPHRSHSSANSPHRHRGGVFASKSPQRGRPQQQPHHHQSQQQVRGAGEISPRRSQSSDHSHNHSHSRSRSRSRGRGVYRPQGLSKVALKARSSKSPIKATKTAEISFTSRTAEQVYNRKNIQDSVTSMLQGSSPPRSGVEPSTTPVHFARPGSKSPPPPPTHARLSPFTPRHLAGGTGTIGRSRDGLDLSSIMPSGRRSQSPPDTTRTTIASSSSNTAGNTNTSHLPYDRRGIDYGFGAPIRRGMSPTKLANATNNKLPYESTTPTKKTSNSHSYTSRSRAPSHLYDHTFSSQRKAKPPQKYVPRRPTAKEPKEKVTKLQPPLAQHELLTVRVADPQSPTGLDISNAVNRTRVIDLNRSTSPKRAANGTFHQMQSEKEKAYESAHFATGSHIAYHYDKREQSSPPAQPPHPPTVVYFGHNCVRLKWRPAKVHSAEEKSSSYTLYRSQFRENGERVKGSMVEIPVGHHRQVEDTDLSPSSIYGYVLIVANNGGFSPPSEITFAKTKSTE